MQVSSLTYFSSIILATIPWLIGSAYMYKYTLHNNNILTKYFLIFNLFFGITLATMTLNYILPVESQILVVAEYIYSILFLIGINALYYAIMIVFFPNINYKPIVMTLNIIIIVLRTYSLLDRLNYSLPLADILYTTANGFILFLTTVLSGFVFISAKKTKINFLKRRLYTLTAVILLCTIGGIIIVLTNNPYQEYRFIISTALIWPITILGVYSVTYRTNDFNNVLGLEGSHKHILSEDDERIAALLWKYTSKEGSCEYYDTTLNSKCRLDPYTHKLIDCQGTKYKDGFICPQIKRLKKDN
ncbi:MAG: hypothetical protein ACTSQY_08645 [Candidatus Odinarchaeia archaeon]